MPARPVSLFTIVFVFALFGAFLLVIRYYYHPVATSAFNAPAENLPKEMEWRADNGARRQALADLRAADAQKISSYAWLDRSSGAVQLPVERAMELTARELAAKQPSRPKNQTN
jgi:hypothetical protein